MINEIIEILKNTPHDEKCDAINKYHIYGCDFDGDRVGTEINAFPGNLECSCTPISAACTCENREKKQAASILEWINRERTY